jgi:hypothetical protein
VSTAIACDAFPASRGEPQKKATVAVALSPRDLLAWGGAEQTAPRLAERVMFAADYPLFRYERLFADWHELGYSEQVLEQIFRRNAETLLAGLRR